MDEKRRHSLEARARIMKALAHPTRLCIVEELAKADRCVRELTEMIGCDISTVSRHLSILKQAGIVHDRKRGLKVWYCLRVPCVLNFFGCVEDVIRANVKQAREAVSK